jgi:hypothetical protein
VGPAVLLAVGFVMLLVGLRIAGGADAQLLQDPGPVVRYGIPITKMIVNLGAAGVLGALVLAIYALRSDKPEYNRALDVAAGSAAVLTVASAATGFSRSCSSPSSRCASTTPTANCSGSF